MLYAKPCCAVDPIENEEDRKKVRLISRFINEMLYLLARSTV